MPLMMLGNRLILRVAGRVSRRFFSDDGVGPDLHGAKAVLTGERGVNRVTLLGRVGQDAQMRGSAENPVTVFPLATSYTLKTREGEYVQKTEWHRISVFRPVLKDLVSQFVRKGDRVYVTGSISYGQFKDKSNNVQRVTSIIAEDVLNMTRPMHGNTSEATEDRSNKEGQDRL